MIVEIVIEPSRSVRWPKMRLCINNHVLHDDFCHPNTENNLFVLSHNLTDPLEQNTISITHYDKDGKETIVDENGDTVSDRALILKTIKIDGEQVPEVVLFDKTFSIAWTSKQLNENPHRPDTIKNNLYFGYNGTYKYCFGNDSRKHYFENLIEKERLANIANKKLIIGPDGKEREAFEFTGKLVDGAQQVTADITDLYNQIKHGS